MIRRFALGFSCALSVACGGSPTVVAPEPPDGRVKALADAYLASYLDRFPETATQFGITGRRHNRLTDNSLAAIKAWDAREDAWFADVSRIDAAAIASAPLRATYAIVRQTIEGDVAKRVCRDELWNVSQMTGWQVSDGYLVTI